MCLRRRAFAVTDEIQVYTGEIAPAGVLGLTWHNNYTPNGFKTPDFPGGLVDNHAYQQRDGMGLWRDALVRGGAVPAALCRYSSNQGWTYNGFKLRALFVQPDNADKEFYYGVNFEFSWNETQWDSQVNTGEIRPIIGWRFGDGFSLTFNPIIDNTTRALPRLEFVPATRLDYKINRNGPWQWRNMTISASCAALCRRDQQSHQLLAVADYTGGPFDRGGRGLRAYPGHGRSGLQADAHQRPHRARHGICK